MTNAERQARYRAKKRNANNLDLGISVTGPAKNVTEATLNVTESAPNVTENPVSGEIPRQSKFPEVVTVTPDNGSEPLPASLEDYEDVDGRAYAFRAGAGMLNWGKWMTSSELADSHYVANRVPILGDWDYNG